MNSVPPRIPKGFHLLRLAGNVLGFAVFYVPAGGGPLEVGVELDAVGWVDVDTLHLAAQSLPLRQGRHYLQTIPQDHAVAPVGLVLVELGAVGPIRQPVEVCE